MQSTHYGTPMNGQHPIPFSIQPQFYNNVPQKVQTDYRQPGSSGPTGYVRPLPPRSATQVPPHPGRLPPHLQSYRPPSHSQPYGLPSHPECAQQIEKGSAALNHLNKSLKEVAAKGQDRDEEIAQLRIDASAKDAETKQQLVEVHRQLVDLQRLAAALGERTRACEESIGATEQESAAFAKTVTAASEETSKATEQIRTFAKAATAALEATLDAKLDAYEQELKLAKKLPAALEEKLDDLSTLQQRIEGLENNERDWAQKVESALAGPAVLKKQRRNRSQECSPPSLCSAKRVWKSKAQPSNKAWVRRLRPRSKQSISA